MQQEAGFRGWWIVGVAFLCSATSTGFAIITYGLFLTPIIAEFGISVRDANVGLSLLTAVMVLAGPVIGPLLDRHSIRAIMSLGALLTAAGFGLMSVVGRAWQLGLLLASLVAVGVAMMGPLSATTVVAKWFERKRGQAVGVASMGPPAGGLLLAPLAGWLIESVGWRGTLRVYALVTLIVVPLIWAIVRNTPQDIGQQVDGGGGAGADDAALAHDPIPASTRIWSTGEVLHSTAFWSLALCVGMVFGFAGGWNANAPRFAEELGYTTQQASLLLGIGAGLGIAGTLLLGTLADRFDNRRLLWVSIAGQIACFGILLGVLRTQAGFGPLAVGWLGFGFIAGGMLPVYASLIGRIFGPASFGKVFGLAGLVMLPWGALAPPLVGWLRDSTADYGASLWLMMGAFTLGGLALLALRIPQGASAPGRA
jgi:MFS family permease